MPVTKDAAPAIIFATLYSFFFVVLTFLYATKRIAWKSRYSFIYFHVILRLGGQACGIAFAVMTWDDFITRLDVLVAYLVLAAEGYFSLVLCTYRFLIVWQQSRFGESVLEPRVPKGTPFWEKMKIIRKSKMGYVHWTLIAANSIIVTGGSLLSSSLSKTTPPNPSTVNAGKAMRVAGTALFLFLVQVFLYYAVQSYKQKGDRTLLIIMLTWPFLTVRGAYGILSIEDDAYSYYNPGVYDADGGMTPVFLAGEYVLGTVMEWMACGLLISTYFLPGMGEEALVEQYGEKKGVDETVEMEDGGAKRV